MLSFFEKLFTLKGEKQADVRYKHSIYQVLVYSLCQDLYFGGSFVRNARSVQAFNLKSNKTQKLIHFF